MFRSLCLVVLCAFLAAAAYAADPVNHAGTVSGKTVDQDGNALPGVAVHVQLGVIARFLGSATSGPDGTFHIDNLPPGDYTLAATKDRLAAAKAIKIEPDKNTDAGALTLAPRKTTTDGPAR